MDWNRAFHQFKSLAYSISVTVDSMGARKSKEECEYDDPGRKFILRTLTRTRKRRRPLR